MDENKKCTCSCSDVDYKSLSESLQEQLTRLSNEKMELEHEVNVFIKYFCNSRISLEQLAKEHEHQQKMKYKSFDVLKEIHTILFGENSPVRMSKETKAKLMTLMRKL